MLSEVVEWEVRLRPRKEGSMSILIKGMGMPKYCGECPILDEWRIPNADVVPRKDYESMERTVDKLNKALAERKRGKWDEAWLDHQYCGCRPRAIYCSNCHIVSAFKTPFCPNCGADMRGKE